ncbi:hypothetical protein OF83DRAFT_1169254 [Amylostereum chailletii]|nr:hypothetical protein OF83DRAFT_1169254 [Amylostereum chailletii]
MEIFSLSTPQDSTDGYHAALAWICLTHVCRFWRDTLLANPLPWADHVCTLPSARDTFLDRAQGTPVTLRIREKDVVKFDSGFVLPRWERAKRDTFHEWLDFCIKHLPRAKRLYLYITEEFDLDREIVTALSNVHLPHLEHLETTGDDTFIGKYTEHCLSNHLTAPNLRRIFLHNSMVPWDPEAVLHLRITETECWGDEDHPSLETLIDLLRPSVNLRTLEFHNDIFLDGTEMLSMQPISQFTLPSLHQLSLRNSTKNCTRFLTSLTPTPLTVVHLNTYTMGEDEDVGQLLSSVGVHLRLGLQTNAISPAALFIRTGEYKVYSPALAAFGFVPIWDIAPTSSKNTFPFSLDDDGPAPSPFEGGPCEHM